MKTSPLKLTALAALPLAFAALPAGAADSPLELKYDAVARELPFKAVGDTCPIHILPAVDERQNKETIGATIGGALLAGDAGPWIGDSLYQLRDLGFKVDRVTDASPRDGITVKATIVRAYTWQIGLKTFGMVALKTEFSNRSGPLQTKHYRAHGDKTNMWGADAEFVTTLNYGINNFLPVLAQDLVSLCKGKTVDAYTYAGPSGAQKK